MVLIAGSFFNCAGPVDEDTRYSELESVWQHLMVHSIFQWNDSTWVPQDPFVFANPSALMNAIPDTINDSYHFTAYGVGTFASVSGSVTSDVTGGNPTVVVDTLTDSTVCVTIREFAYEQTWPEFEALLRSVATFPFLIIDLRGNGGGYIDQVQPIADAFLPADTAYLHVREREYDRSTRTAKTVDHLWKSKKPVRPELSTKKVTILMDHGSASASEILIVALKEKRNAVLVGSTTYGKGIGQIEIVRRDRPGMKITSLQFSGVKKIGNYHRVGIAPDVTLGPLVDQRAALLAAVRVNEPAASTLRSVRALRKTAVSPGQVVEKRLYEE